MTPEETREALLQAALPHVMFDGWSEATIRAAAREYAEEVRQGAFPAAEHTYPGPRRPKAAAAE